MLFERNKKTEMTHSRKVVITMTQRKIFLRSEEVNEFVKKATKCDFDIDISYNRFVVDAKSILGVLGLDLRQALTVTCHGYDADFEKYLGKFAIAC